MKDNIILITKSDGKKYSVRKDRHRYFFPEEWNKFYKTLKNEKHRILFLTLLNTGARIMEALHLKPKNFNFERNTVTFEVIKHRVAKKRVYGTGTSRTFNVSEKFLREIKNYIKDYKISEDKYLFLNNDSLSSDYDNLSNAEKRKYFIGDIIGYSQMFKRKLKKAGIPDYNNFSLHNIRKTYGNWMRVFDIQMAELCYRMGHDINTFMSNYGSSLIFTPQERREILNIIGEVK